MDFLLAQSVKTLPAVQKTRVRSLGWEDPLEKEMANPLQYSCLENLMARNLVVDSPWSLVGYSHGTAKSRARLSD